MPDEPPPKLWQHPLRQPASPPTHGADAHHEAAPALSGAVRRLARPRWGELAVTSNHTFLCGASHPEELVREAARLGHAGIALTDFETFGGAVRAHVAAREAVVGDQGGQHAGAPMKLAHGTRVRFSIADPPWPGPADGVARAFGGETLDLLLYPSDRASWGALCRLLTKARTAGAVVPRAEAEPSGP
jgi:error-prone DNA polymerase